MNIEEYKFSTILSQSDCKTLNTLTDKAAEPMLTHGIDAIGLSYLTANTLYEIGMERSCIMLALADPFVKFGIITIDEAQRLFGDDIARLLTLIMKLRQKTITLDNISDKQFSDFVLSFAEDIRVVITGVAYSHELMKELDKMPDELEGRKRQAALSRLFYAPIAHRLGLYNIKRDLEDLSVKFEHPDIFYEIVHGLKQTRNEREKYLEDFISSLREKIEALGISYEIKWRTKSIHSIYQKMVAQGIGIDGIFDLFALRVILDIPENLEKAFCWAVFGVTSSLYVPNMLRTRDWISKPKASGYESLHTTVLGPDNHWVEVQIRSKRMDEIAEHGMAAHWKYKGVKGSDNTVNDALLAIRSALETRSEVDSLIKSFSDELYKDQIFVFDNKDTLHKIPTGSRIVDYIIHIAPEADWVELFTGANINGEFQNLDYPLSNGDRVELVVRM